MSAFLIGALALAGSINRGGPAVPPATSAPAVTTMGAEEAAVTVVDLLDGSRLEVVGPFDLGLTGHQFFLDQPGVGDTSVYVSPFDDPADAAAVESAEFEVDLGSGVQLWRGNREGQPLFMSVDLDGWVVFLHVGWDTPPSSHELLTLAEGLRGKVTDHGVVLSNDPAETFDTYLGSPDTENSIHLGIGECARDVIPGSEIIEHSTRGQVVRGTHYASWCDTTNDLEVRVHGDEAFVTRNLGGLTLRRGVPELQPTTTTPSTTTLAPEEPAVTSIPIEVEVPLRVLAVRPNNPSLSVLDLEEQTTTVYPPGLHALPSDAVDGAVSTPDRDWIVWSNGIARLISESPEQVDVELGPHPPRSIGGVAPALRAIPTPDGAEVWLVQPGITWGDSDFPTLIDLVPISGGLPVLEVEADGEAFPVAATDTGLVLNVHRWLDTGDGFITDPGSEFVIHITEDGSTTRVGDGRAIAAGPSRVARLGSNSLLVSGPDGSEELQVDKPLDGAWRAVGGPMIPSDAMPFNSVAPDGIRLLVSVGQDFDVNGKPARAVLLVVDMATGTSRTIAEVGGATPLATWSADGRWVAMFSGSDITLVNVENPEDTILLEGVVPPDHFPLAAG